MFLCDTQVSQENKSFFPIISKYHMKKNLLEFMALRIQHYWNKCPLRENGGKLILFHFFLVVLSWYNW
jgi:hypothetical protein